MAGRGKELLKSFPETSIGNAKRYKEGAMHTGGDQESRSELRNILLRLALRRKVEGAVEDEPEPESELPIELVEKILSQLSLYDNLLASGVCRRWRVVAKSVRKSNKHPWLLYFPRSGDKCELYDPVERSFYCIELQLPDLRNCLVCYCKDSWLLMFNFSTRFLFFFNPYTRETIRLPKQQLPSDLAAFSESPTSPHCVLFSVKQIRPNIIAVSTCSPGDKAWTTVHYQNAEPFVSSDPNQAIYCNGHFYCLSRSGYVGVYDPLNAVWGVLSVPRPACMKMYSVDNGERAKYMAEHDGEVYLIYTYPFLDPFVHKLNRDNHTWEVIEDLGGLTIFANFHTSHVRKDMVGIVRNSIYFSKVIYYGKRNVVYSMNKSRYYPRKEGYDLLEIEPNKNIWIDAPDDLSILL